MKPRPETEAGQTRPRAQCPECLRLHLIGTAGAENPCLICGDVQYVEACPNCDGRGIESIAATIEEPPAPIEPCTYERRCEGPCGGTGLIPSPQPTTIH
jgi:hypothetical protein